LIPFAQQLDAAYRRESNADVRERIFLVRRVRVDKVQASSVAELELHKTRIWAYKWLKRYDIDGIEGLRNRHRSGRPPDVSEEKILGIRTEEATSYDDVFDAFRLAMHFYRLSQY
jgi:transposase